MSVGCDTIMNDIVPSLYRMFLPDGIYGIKSYPSGQGCLPCFGRRRKTDAFLQAVRDGDRSNAIQQIESTPDLAKSTTYHDKKNALHLAAEEGHLVVLNAVLEVLTCQESIRNTAEGGGDAAESIHSILNAQVCVRVGFPV